MSTPLRQVVPGTPSKYKSSPLSDSFLLYRSPIRLCEGPGSRVVLCSFRYRWQRLDAVVEKKRCCVSPPPPPPPPSLGGGVCVVWLGCGFGDSRVTPGCCLFFFWHGWSDFFPLRGPLLTGFSAISGPFRTPVSGRVPVSLPTLAARSFAPSDLMIDHPKALLALATSLASTD